MSRAGTHKASLLFSQPLQCIAHRCSLPVLMSSASSGHTLHAGQGDPCRCEHSPSCHAAAAGRLRSPLHRRVHTDKVTVIAGHEQIRPACVSAGCGQCGEHRRLLRHECRFMGIDISHHHEAFLPDARVLFTRAAPSYARLRLRVPPRGLPRSSSAAHRVPCGPHWRSTESPRAAPAARGKWAPDASDVHRG